MSSQTGTTVVVGVDGPEMSRRAQAWAGGFADAVDADVLLLTAWHNAMMWGDVVPRLDSEAAARQVVQGAVVTCRASFPNVCFAAQVADRPAASALVEASRDARLLVVGSRSYGWFKAMLRGGSVSAHCIRHACCPVSVVREVATMECPRPSGWGRSKGARVSEDGGR